MDTINKKHSELLQLVYGNYFNLFLTIDFQEKKDYYIVESKKFKLKIESTNKNLNEAKEEFLDVINTLIKVLINDKTIFSVFEYLKIQQKPVQQIIQEKIIEIKEKNSAELNLKHLTYNPTIELSRVNPIFNWQQN